jgi:hypothetical protein
MISRSPIIASVSLQSNDDVDALGLQLRAAVEHRERLTRARCGAQVDGELSVSHAQAVRDRSGERRRQEGTRDVRLRVVGDEDVPLDLGVDEAARQLVFRDAEKRCAQLVHLEGLRFERFQQFDVALVREPFELRHVGSSARQDLDGQVQRGRNRRAALEEARGVDAGRNDQDRARGAGRRERWNGQAVDRAQQQLAQHHERPLLKRTGQRAFDVVGPYDLALFETASKKFRRSVQRDHFVRRFQKRLGNDLAHGVSDEGFGSRRDRVEMLDVERAQDGDSRFSQRERILPALLVAAAREIVVGQLVQDDGIGL